MTSRIWLGVGGAAVLVTALTGPAFASTPKNLGSPLGDQARACGTPIQGEASCGAIQLLNPSKNWHGNPSKGPSGTSSTPTGYYPGDLQSAYGLSSPSSSYGVGETVAIVDAYNDPNALKDLNTYRTYFNGKAGLVTGTATTAIPPICGTTTNCVTFTKYNQIGSTSSFPRNNIGWSEEISLDLDMVSAICPNCNIALVEANSANFSDLQTAVTFAKSIANVVAVSNSYGGSEFSNESNYNSVYSFTNTAAMTVSSGDSGYGVEFPAASPNVTATGGTTLTYSTSSGTLSWSQTAWSGAGSGCSTYESAPSWQSSSWDTACSNRTVSDTSAVADPNTGVAVYDSFHKSGWMVFGGTSVASPLVSAVYALASGYSLSTSSAFSPSPSGLYASTAPSLYNVTSGSNGSCGTYLCNAATSLSPASMPYYDGPTGMGTPAGASSLTYY